MGTLGGGNGGERPADGGQPDGLPGLPPEWGTIIIPDDPSALVTESAQVRREMRKTARQARWRGRFGLSPHTTPDEPSIRLPLLIMAIAVVATLTSLFAVAWPRPQAQPLDLRNARTVPDVTLVDSEGAAVRLAETVPAVVVLVDGCECAPLVTDVALGVDGGVAVLAVGRTVPSVPAPAGTALPPNLRRVADPASALRTALGLPPPAVDSASVALFSRAGGVVRVLPDTRSLNDFRMDLAALR